MSPESENLGAPVVHHEVLTQVRELDQLENRILQNFFVG